jgi:glycosyltransferase involved in cell wall biosynthesis
MFSIVTPSFRSGRWLKLCIASVADQGVPLEHVVQDAGSDDGTLEWLPRDVHVRAFVEKDAGMYDAVNRGLRRAKGEFLAYLNCDEQYLPGALKAATEFFTRYPDIDVLFGDVVMVNAQGDYLSHRKMQTPLLYHTWTCHLSTLTCAMFFRRRILERGFWFDAKWRDSGDSEWMVRLLRDGVKMGVLRQFTSIFTQSGANMSAGENARRENRELARSAPVWAQRLRPALIAHHRLRRLLGGMYSQAPFSYEIYTQASPEQRKRFWAQSPTFKPQNPKTVNR